MPGFGTALFVTAHYASSRTLLTRLTPPGTSLMILGFLGMFFVKGGGRSSE
jgi:MFS-type transporter involved in bile tolerance (Atg22 family)